jgi:hypothetical protein
MFLKSLRTYYLKQLHVLKREFSGLQVGAAIFLLFYFMLVLVFTLALAIKVSHKSTIAWTDDIRQQ